MGNMFHREYKAFNANPVIGGIQVNDDFDHLTVMVAHEVAHHIQYRYCRYVKRFRQTYRKPHGKCFQAIYAYLRRDMVNKVIKNKMEGKTLYVGA